MEIFSTRSKAKIRNDNAADTYNHIEIKVMNF